MGGIIMGKKDVVLMPRSVDIGGSKHKIIYTMRAMYYLETEYGGIDEALESLNKDKDIMNSFKFLYAGLLVHHKDVELDDLIDMLEIGKIGKIFKTMNEAINDAFESVDEEELKQMEKELQEQEEAKKDKKEKKEKK